MPHPRARTWTLATLDRGEAYRLWFDPASRRWEVRPEGQAAGTLTTRATTTAGGGAPRPQRSEERGAPGRRGASGESGAAA